MSFWTKLLRVFRPTPPLPVSTVSNGHASVAVGGSELLDGAQNYYAAVNHNDLGAKLYQDGNLSAAVDEFLNAIRLCPRYETAYCNLAAAFLQGRQPGAAIEVLEKLLASPQPEQWEQVLGNRPQRAKAAHYMALAKEARDSQNIDAAAYVAELSCSLDPPGMELWKKLVNMKIGDRAGAARLVMFEKRRSPDDSIESSIASAIDRLAEDVRRRH